MSRIVHDDPGLSTFSRGRPALGSQFAITGLGAGRPLNDRHALPRFVALRLIAHERISRERDRKGGTEPGDRNLGSHRRTRR
jgi:hypothetical protein